MQQAKREGMNWGTQEKIDYISRLCEFISSKKG